MIWYDYDNVMIVMGLNNMNDYDMIRAWYDDFWATWKLLFKWEKVKGFAKQKWRLNQPK